MQTPSLVAVRKIQARTSASSFPHEAVDAAARLIIAAGALATPLLIRRTGLESFDLVGGDFAYHAAARARELDPFNAEMVLAFILEGEQAAPMMEQASLFGQPDGQASAPVPTGDLGTRLGNFERRMEQLVAELGSRMSGETRTIRQATEALEARMPRPAEPLRVLNEASERELLERLTKVGIKGKTAATLVRGIMEARTFRTFAEVQGVKGLGGKRFALVIDACAVPGASHPTSEPKTLLTIS